MLRKHAAKFHSQWDRFLPGVLWAYRNTPQESTKDNPSFLLFGTDLKSPTEASFLPPDPLSPTDLGSCQEEVMLSLSSARELVVASIRKAQKNYDKRPGLFTINWETGCLSGSQKRRQARSESLPDHGMVHSES